MHNVLLPLTYLGLGPYMIALGRALQTHHGLTPVFLAVTPAEAAFAKNNLSGDSLELSLGEAPVLRDNPQKAELNYESLYGFMKAKYGGSAQVWRERVDAVYRIVERVMVQRQISHFVVWNGSDCVGRVCQMLAQKHGLKIVYLENGYFPNTLQIDPRGVNAQASICKLPYAEWGASTLGNLVPRAGAPIQPGPIVPLGFFQRLKLKLASRLNTRFYDRYPELRDQKNKKFVETSLVLSSSQEVLSRKKPFALLVLQVHDDTQILLNSRLFASPQAFLLHCHDSVRKVFGPDYDIVVKLHPADMSRICYAQLAEGLTGVSWIGADPVEPLLAVCEFVMVINSSVGLQSIASHKPTLVYGESFYSRKEICMRVSELEETCGLLDALKNSDYDVDTDLVDEFVASLNQHYFVEGSWKLKSDSDIAPAVNKINLLLKTT